jgi:hypothetical protein
MIGELTQKDPCSPKKRSIAYVRLCLSRVAAPALRRVTSLPNSYV